MFLSRVNKKLNVETGEIREEVVDSFIKKTTGEKYCILFEKGREFLLGLTKKYEVVFCNYLLSRMVEEGNTIRFTDYDRDFLVKEFDVNRVSITRSKTTLKKNEMLKEQKGLIFINPSMFWRGSLKDYADAVNQYKQF